MPNLSTAPIIKHAKLPQTNDQHVLHILGVTTSQGVVLTAKSPSYTASFISTTKGTGSHFLIQTYTYSYDGIVHVESYASDI